MPKLFGTSGIRGPAEALFTKEFCTKLGVVFGQWLKDKGKSGYVAVAMDPRESSPRIKQHIISGLASLGWEILDEGVVPTPALTYFVKQSPHVGGGVMITGSHITADLNGVKLFIDGEEVTKEHEQEIEELFQKLEFKTVVSSPIVKFESTAEELYINLLSSLADLPYPKWKIVLDTANGAQSEIMRDVLKKLGLEFTCSDYCDIQSPHFIPRDTESQAGMGEIMRDVIVHAADLAVVFDVDGDRVVFVDNTGRMLPGDYSCALIAQDSPSSKIVTPISTCSVIDQLGKKIYRTPVGSTFVAAKMKEVGATFGFEPNGGGISSEIFYGRDGGTTMIKILNILKTKKQSLSDLYSSLPAYYLYKDKVDCSPDRYAQIYNAARDKYAGKQIDDTDGVKVDLGQEDWILFRASGNAPEFRVFAQSKAKSRADQLGQESLAWVKSLIHTSGQIVAPVFADSLHIKESIQAFADQFSQVQTEMSQQEVPADCMLASNLVVSGMGGSALAGRILASLERQILKIPVTVSTEYHLPNFVDASTLVIISSYSGNTEETLSSLTDAMARKSRIFILTSGGQLAEIAAEKNIPAYVFEPKHNPSNQPRMGLGYSIASLLFLLARCQLVHTPADLTQLSSFLKSRQPEAEAQGRELARKLAGKVMVLLSSEHLKGSAHAVKNMLNENSKNLAFGLDLPEASHHLMEGLAFPQSNPRDIVFLLWNSQFYSPPVSARYPITSEIVAKQHIGVVDFPLSGSSPLQEAMAAIQSGAWLSYYLAGYNRIDPGPIPWVDYLKDKLNNG